MQNSWLRMEPFLIPFSLLSPKIESREERDVSGIWMIRADQSSLTTESAEELRRLWLSEQETRFDGEEAEAAAKESVSHLWTAEHLYREGELGACVDDDYYHAEGTEGLVEITDSEAYVTEGEVWDASYADDENWQTGMAGELVESTEYSEHAVASGYRVDGW